MIISRRIDLASRLPLKTGTTDGTANAKNKS
jgi:hypothetical protein